MNVDKQGKGCIKDDQLDKDSKITTSCHVCRCDYRNISVDRSVNAKSQDFDDDNSNNISDVNFHKRTFIKYCIKFMSFIGIYYFFSSMLKSMLPNDDILASECLDVDLRGIGEGENVVKYWQGKPVFIKHRTVEEIYEANNVSLNALKDPEEDFDRIKQFQEKWLVVIGICTHLGCVPVHDKGVISGGWLCPCHNSEYDTSGRVISGPAKRNLEVPPYYFVSDSVIRIGVLE
ncbi:MAG: ubiquinol-cytochrome c reductase iron-sulfur subunit [Pseudomonadota bacterium]